MKESAQNQRMGFARDLGQRSWGLKHSHNTTVREPGKENWMHDPQGGSRGLDGWCCEGLCYKEKL